MNLDFIKETRFKLGILVVITIFMFLGTTFLFNSQIDKLKKDADNIYFGNYIPIIKLENVLDKYREIIFCKENGGKNCNYDRLESELDKEWNYYKNAYKTKDEKVIVEEVDKIIKKAYRENDFTYFKEAMEEVEFLIETEQKVAYFERKLFLNEYASIKDKLFYNLVLFVLFFCIVIFLIFYKTFKNKDDSTKEETSQASNKNSNIDEMTKLYNKKHFEKLFEEMPIICDSNNCNSLFMLVDIDLFKDFNEKYGTQKGDYVLKKIAITLSEKFSKKYDYVFRIDKDIFAILTFNRRKDSIHEIIEELRESIINLDILHDKNEVENIITVSIGASLYEANNNIKPVDLYKLTNKKLYNSKKMGRNQYTI